MVVGDCIANVLYFLGPNERLSRQEGLVMEKVVASRGGANSRTLTLDQTMLTSVRSVYNLELRTQPNKHQERH